MGRRLRKPHLQGLFAPVSLVCYSFLPEDNNEKRRRVTVIIAPIKVVEFEDGSPGVGFACSRGPFCHDPYCRYSKVAKDKNSSSDGRKT